MAVDMFLKIVNIEGESQDDKHKGELQIESFSFGATQPATHGTGGGGGGGKVSMQDFHLVIPMGKHSPKIFLACSTGEHLKEATLVCRKAGTKQQEYYTVKFTDLIVSSYQVGASTHANNPTDQISLNFSKIEMDYKEQKADGSLGSSTKAGYDIKANKTV